MHDFLLAKEIIDTLLEKAEENNLKKISEAVLEIGTISMAHDGFDEHTEDVSVDNLKFGLKTISKGTILEKTDFKISKVKGDSWRLVSMK
ncbi:MAG: hydrogenase/urease maturation nickel metallochaperone HypA [Candidatus Moranbacteria bacterium]|jgi:Zn finger protein HypA/HybF involved in hydrogenase expression|nr:hydrogenase/urease maturation nickel metallochaperone HypA [Candidatus Moranbacteria bacterium]MDD5652003.1 hydrogenase/urease maturation nickel metallochaperone HypA [Candidatus Moranbacteria bacterium]MDX9855872.1 hydrogenase/urease maturation nickel metallochaperone HypA [Candidatus Moranbacteria bacterium]